LDNRIKLVLGVLALACIGSAGCSSDSDGPSHGVSQAKQLNSLTQPEIDKICADVESRMKDASEELSPEGFESMMDDEFMCKATAVGMTKAMGGTTADCQTRQEDCLENLEEAQKWNQESEEEDWGDWEDSSDSEEMDCGTPEEYSDCEATVGQIDACFNAVIREMKKIANQVQEAMDEVEAAMKKISCNNLDADMVDMEDISLDLSDIEDVKGLEDIPECRAVEDQCPGVMFRDSDMSYSGPPESSSW